MAQEEAGRGGTGKAAVGYLRRSTDRQEQSIPDQRKAVERYAQEHGFKLVSHYVDDAVSGTSTAGRKAFQQMMADAQKPGCPFGTIIVYDVKRFGRVDNDEAGYYRFLLRQAGVEVRYASENFGGDDTDDLLRPVKQWQARQESKDLAKVTIRGLLSRVEGGWWLGGVPPYGYDLAYYTTERKFLFTVRYLDSGEKLLLDEAGKETRRLPREDGVTVSKKDHSRLGLSDPERVQVVQRIFRMYVEGYGFKGVTERLNGEGVPSPRSREWSRINDGHWSDSTIRSILVNPLYVGDLVWNRRTDARFFRIADGRSVDRKQESAVRLEPNGEADWIVVRNSHPAIIDRGTFEQAEQVRKRRAGGRTGPVHRNGWGERLGYLLTGLVTCADCGHHYQGRTVRKGLRRKDGSAVRTLYYACGGYITKGRAVCRQRLFPKEHLEGLVLAEVKKRIGDLHSAGRRGLAGKLREALGSCQGEVKNEMRKLRSQLERIERITPNLLDNITSTNRELVDRRLRQLQREKELLEVRLGELATAEVKEAEVQELTKELWDFLSRFEDTMASGPLEAKRAALRRFVKALSVQQQATRLEMELYGLPLPPALAPSAAAERATVACSAATSGPQGGNG